METKRRLVVMISGSGTNLQAILDACAEGRLPAEVVLVVSNRKQAFGLQRAARAGVPTLYFPLKPYKEAGRSREEYDRDLAEQVAQWSPDLIVLAGWMHILSPAFLDRFPNRVINLHPALPGMFPGTHAIQRAFEAYQRGEIEASGCMVHYVIPEVDAGPVIATARVPIFPEDTLETFEQRMHETEHRLIVEATHKALEALPV
ncbi:MAG: phosphoribosylglycinamide formyltransferase [Ardenticatenia bacterium]|uniref:Phosphoribosylglycinamide formyltransferase n=1 Tax=Ardenticatena maritima TaxID=872965 RepID=A0A0M8K7X1_9CHLR|nr:phosphoribosylglycinamide formyltransferase [Ardenticatena maritima]KPL88000.1 phosphoribosylglycinamide formyltransferase [Ardenticatena maritima]RME11502.1 MAG: phosphoribosylglycinamide formyltransferase [Ardenticatenia bacterium]GAP63633.1 phosphoribosylglycinamide formyltransferase [Ardenticatena maritima]